ncbi:MAG: type II toxin-antitoxin system VapC family toxin [Vulcanimicrobiota bacterium]
MGETLIILDTCTLLWLSDISYSLPSSVKEALRSCPPSERFVSAITAFEIGFKSALGKLNLPVPAKVWFEETCAQRGIQSLPLTASVAMRASQLPLHHRDPADRFIISTALEFQLKILTPDKIFSKYDAAVVWD